MASTATMDTGKPLTGRKVLAILLSCFGVVFTVNGYMAYHAVSTFRGETADHPYEVGIKFNGELEKADEQAARHWRVDVSLENGTSASFRDAEGQTLTGLTVTGVYAAPADTQRDRRFALAETSPGRYAGAAAPSGVWDLELTAKRGEAVLFQSASRLTLDVPALASLNPGHWRVGITIMGSQARVGVRDAQGKPVEGLTVGGQFAAPKEDRTRNRAFTTRETAPGDYLIDAAALQSGPWELELSARRGEETLFQSRNPVDLR